MGFSSSGGAKVGSIEMFGGTTPPDGYLLCNGGAISRSLYSDLFAVIGTTYGAGDGSTTFNLPNYTSASMVASSNVSIKGNGKTLGLTDGTNNYGLQAGNGGTANNWMNAMTSSTSSYSTNAGTSYNTSGMSTKITLGVTKDAAKSGISGTLNLANSCKFIIKY